MHDALTSQWLMPLDPLLNQCYNSRFRISSEVTHYLVFDDAFRNGHAWQTPDEFYLRSRMKAEDLARHGYFCNHHLVVDVPTGYGEVEEEAVSAAQFLSV